MNFFIKNLKYVIIIVFALSIYIQDWDVKNNKEPRWRDGVAHFICNQVKCTIEVFDKNNNKIQSKKIYFDEIVSFSKYVDKTRAKNYYASYVIKAKTKYDYDFDFFEVDTYYDDDIQYILNLLNRSLNKKHLNIDIIYPKSRAKN